MKKRCREGEEAEVSREKHNPPAASFMQNMSRGWLLTATLQPLYGGPQGVHCKQWHFCAAPAALWNSFNLSPSYYSWCLRMFLYFVFLGSRWGSVPVISQRDGNRVVARMTGEERREGGTGCYEGGCLGFVVAAQNLGPGFSFFFVSSLQLSKWVETLDKNGTRVVGIMVLPPPSFLCLSSCLLMSSLSFLFSQWWPQLRSCAGDPAAARREEAETPWQPTYLPLSLNNNREKKSRGREKKKTHQHKQMRPCTVWRTSSSLMDTSCPSTPTPPPQPRPQLLHPPVDRLPHPHRRPTANTMKSWRTCPAPGLWTAMKEGPEYLMGTVVDPGSLRLTLVAAVLTTTTNPGTGASPGGRERTGAKLTPTHWESRWPQTAGKTCLLAWFFNCLHALNPFDPLLTYPDQDRPHPLLINEKILHHCGASMEQSNEI